MHFTEPAAYRTVIEAKEYGSERASANVSTSVRLALPPGRIALYTTAPLLPGGTGRAIQFNGRRVGFNGLAACANCQQRSALLLLRLLLLRTLECILPDCQAAHRFDLLAG